MKNRVKCVLFDLDGTLVSTGGAGNRALERAFYSLFKLKNAMEGINPAGKTDPAIIREIFLKRLSRNCAEEEMSLVQNRYLELLPEECSLADQYQVMAGIPKILSRLRENDVVVGLGTGNLEKGARIKLDRSQLNPYLPFGGFGSDSENRAELLEIAYRKAQEHSKVQIPKEDVFVVGDTERDILAAKQSGLKVVAVATGHAGEKFLKEYNPDFCLPNFENEESFLKIIL